MGWTKDSWHGLAPAPTSWTTLFEELTVGEQRAVEQLCYTKEMWDESGFVVAPEADVAITLAPIEVENDSMQVGKRGPLP